MTENKVKWWWNSFIYYQRAEALWKYFLHTILLSRCVTPALSMWNVGVFYDNFNFSEHIYLVCRSCFYNILHLSSCADKTTSTDLVTSRRDYCHSLFTKVSLVILQNIFTDGLTTYPRFSNSVCHFLFFALLSCSCPISYHCSDQSITFPGLWCT